ncbi:hypothetical protein, partial [Aeromonas caviae]
MAATDEPSIVPRGVLPMRLCEVSVKPPPLFTHEKGAVPIMCWKANLEVGHHREDLHHGYASLPTPVVPLSI